MRIYDGSPRQDWEEVLRSIGGLCRQRAPQGDPAPRARGRIPAPGPCACLAGSADSETFGALVKRTYELTDDQVGEMMEASAAKRGTADADRPHADLLNYYELALRILGAYIDGQKAHDVFLLEQEGSFVLRLYGVTGSRGRPPAVRIHARRDVGYDRVRT